MQPSLAFLQHSLFNAAEPIAILLWGCGLIFISMKLRSASRTRVPEATVPVDTSSDSTVALGA